MATLRCPSCGAGAQPTAVDFECACGELFDVEHRFPATISRALFDGRRPSLRAPGSSGVWRFRELVYPQLPRGAPVSLCEGNTPLYSAPRLASDALIGELWFKHEGHNPTGSFKDRGMTVAVTRAVASGAKHLVCASTGNTAASMAAYAARAGVRASVVVPERATALGKLGQAVAHGARVVLVRGSFDDAFELVRTLAREGAVTLLNSANPFRIEGQKTIVLETLQQLAWQPPDWIVFPAGNLGNCAAFGKALREAHATGLIDRVPRLAAIQAAGAAPFAAAFDRGFDALVPVEARTLATAIRIGHPVSYARAVRAVRETNGTVLAVGDDEILDAKAAIDAEGLGAEPASCAAFAGAKKLALRGIIDSGESVVCVLTGHLLKDPESTLDYHRGALEGIDARRANAPVTVDAELGALRSALDA